jgi:hypothetical protein
MRRMAMIAALIACAGEAWASEPVFLPDFTPATGEEFGMAVTLQQMVMDQLLAEGHIVLSSAVVGPVIGMENIASCALRAGCPTAVLPKIPARIAVVVQVQRVGGSLVGNVDLFESGAASASQRLYLPIAAGGEAGFASEVAREVRTLLVRIGPAPAPMVTQAAQWIAGQGTIASAPLAGTPAPGMPAPGAPVPGAPVAAKRFDGSTPHEGPLEPLLQDSGILRRHLVGAEGAFRRSGLHPRDWVYRMTPHAGRLIFEIHAGAGFGDVDRLAVVRVETQNGDETNAWFQEGPLPGRRPRGEIYVGFAPATMVDLGILGGLQYGRRGVSTGLVVLDAEGGVDQLIVNDLEDIQAVTLYLQPRARAYLAHLGPAKPYLLTGADLRFFDSYHLEQPPDVNYPAPSGGFMPGWVGGAGMLIDPGPIVGFFAEGTYVRHFGQLSAPRRVEVGGAWPHEFEPLEETSAITVGVVGGVQFRL